MKTTTHHFVALVTLLSTFSFANAAGRADQDIAETVQTYSVASDDNLKKPELNLEEEMKFIDSVASISVENQNPIAYRIEENKQIIEAEAETFMPLYLDRTIEDVIREDNQIIESNLVNETFPLDFQLINKYENANKNADFKNTVFKKRTIKS